MNSNLDNVVSAISGPSVSTEQLEDLLQEIKLIKIDNHTCRAVFNMLIPLVARKHNQKLIAEIIKQAVPFLQIDIESIQVIIQLSEAARLANDLKSLLPLWSAVLEMITEKTFANAFLLHVCTSITTHLKFLLNTAQVKNLDNVARFYLHKLNRLAADYSLYFHSETVDDFQALASFFSALLVIKHNFKFEEEIKAIISCLFNQSRQFTTTRKLSFFNILIESREHQRIDLLWMCCTMLNYIDNVQEDNLTLVLSCTECFFEAIESLDGFLFSRSIFEDALIGISVMIESIPARYLKGIETTILRYFCVTDKSHMILYYISLFKLMASKRKICWIQNYLIVCIPALLSNHESLYDRFQLLGHHLMVEVEHRNCLQDLIVPDKKIETQDAKGLLKLLKERFYLPSLYKTISHESTMFIAEQLVKLWSLLLLNSAESSKLSTAFTNGYLILCPILDIHRGLNNLISHSSTRLYTTNWLNAQNLNLIMLIKKLFISNIFDGVQMISQILRLFNEIYEILDKETIRTCFMAIFRWTEQSHASFYPWKHGRLNLILVLAIISANASNLDSELASTIITGILEYCISLPDWTLNLCTIETIKCVSLHPNNSLNLKNSTKQKMREFLLGEWFSKNVVFF